MIKEGTSIESVAASMLEKTAAAMLAKVPQTKPEEDHATIINKQIKVSGVDTNLISDGYHTFGELYDHRISIFITMLRIMSKHGSSHKIWRSKAHSDGDVWKGWFILGYGDQPGEQITYHLPIERWEECEFAKTLSKAPEWDGHTSADVLERLNALYVNKYPRTTF